MQPQQVRFVAFAGEDLVAIDSFVQQNAQASAYLAWLHDSQTAADPQVRARAAAIPTITLDQLIATPAEASPTPAVYKTCLLECIQHSTDLEAVLIGLSDLYEQLRAVERQPAADMQGNSRQPEAEWVAPTWFQRSTTKYWVQPHNRMRVKCEIVKNLPVSIYGKQRSKLASGGLALACRARQKENAMSLCNHNGSPWQTGKDAAQSMHKAMQLAGLHICVTLANQTQHVQSTHASNTCLRP